jgi:hypothetical protein
MTAQPTATFRVGIPVVLVLFTLVNVAILGWLGSAGFPMTTSDSVMLKQAAYMYLHTGQFSAPTAADFHPRADEVFGFYTPFYTYASLATFAVFGFSLETIIAFDLAVHFLLGLSLALLLYRLTRNQWLAGLSMFVSAYLIFPIGRPEALATLLIVWAIIIVLRWPNRVLLPALLLGLSLNTSLLNGLSGVIIFGGIFYALKPDRWQRLIHLTMGYAVAGVILIVLWLPTTLANLPLAIEQFLHALDDHVVIPIWQVIEGDWMWGAAFIILTLSSWLALVVLARGHRRFGLTPPQRNVALALLVAMPVNLLLLHLAGTFAYGYRFNLYMAIVIILYTLHVVWVARERQPALRYVAIGGAVVILLASSVAALDLLRYVVAPLTWGETAIDFRAARDLVRDYVPPDASVGGDGRLWWAITDGRPFYATRWISVDD